MAANRVDALVNSARVGIIAIEGRIDAHARNAGIGGAVVEVGAVDGRVRANCIVTKIICADITIIARDYSKVCCAHTVAAIGSNECVIKIA